MHNRVIEYEIAYYENIFDVVLRPENNLVMYSALQLLSLILAKQPAQR